ncbi:hypothetical protein GGR56DRAFT_627078 [Xylariaceae sp. FL0804]|nr:hypothetical protein GGR56DRAFT_627078 [Xylariaceae sp. FL0804]
MEKKKKLAFQLDTPYSVVSWPRIQTEDQDIILELLCALLAPLGHYRTEHVQPSKGKRARKRKHSELSGLPPPPPPELSSYVDVGLASITRSLQIAASEQHRPSPLKESKAPPTDNSTGIFYSIVFVARSGQPGALSSHLPQMVATASKSYPGRPPVRLVGLSKACEDRLSSSLGIPRASCIGLRDAAPNSQALVEFVRRCVPAVEVPWLQEAPLAEHREAKINVVETFTGPRRPRAKAKGKA